MRTAALAAIAAAGCAPISLGDGERRIALRDLGTEVIVPQLFELSSEAMPLIHAVGVVAEVRLPVYLEMAREEWRRARRAWKRTEAFGFGPAAGLELDAPVDGAAIEAELLGPGQIDEEYLDGLPGSRKGFHAIEYLLYRLDGNDQAVLAAFGSARRRQYVLAVAQNIVARLDGLRHEWADDHADRIATPAADDLDYPTIDRAIGAVAGECAAVAARVADARLSAPAGLGSGAPRPDLAESPLSDNSIADMADALRGVRNIYYGTRSGEPGRGLGEIVAAAAPEIDAQARAAIEAAIVVVQRIPAPYGGAIAAQHPEIAAAHAAVEALRRIWAGGVTPLLTGATMPAD